mgnify:CR=1 FL=1
MDYAGYFLISGFSVYEIIKYHRLTRKLKKITEKRTCFLPGIGDVEYRISPLIGSPYTIGFLKPFIVAPESLDEFPDSSEIDFAARIIHTCAAMTQL